MGYFLCGLKSNHLHALWEPFLETRATSGPRESVPNVAGVHGDVMGGSWLGTKAVGSHAVHDIKLDFHVLEIEDAPSPGPGSAPSMAIPGWRMLTHRAAPAPAGCVL